MKTKTEKKTMIMRLIYQETKQ